MSDTHNIIFIGFGGEGAIIKSVDENIENHINIIKQLCIRWKQDTKF